MVTRSTSHCGGRIKKQKVEKQAQKVSLRRTLKMLGLWSDTQSVIDQSVASSSSPPTDLDQSLGSDASFNTKNVGNTPPPSHGVLSTTRPVLADKNNTLNKKPTKKAKKQLFKGLKSLLATESQENLNATTVEPSVTKKPINVFRSKSINRLADLAPKLRRKIDSSLETKLIAPRSSTHSVASPKVCKSLINLTSPEVSAPLVGYAEVGVQRLRSFASVHCVKNFGNEMPSVGRPRRSSRRFSDQLDSPLQHLAQLSLNSGSPRDACETSLNATLTGDESTEYDFRTAGPRWRQLTTRLAIGPDCKTPTNNRILSPSPYNHRMSVTPKTLTKKSLSAKSSLKKSSSKSFSSLSTSMSSLRMKPLLNDSLSEKPRSSVKRRRSNRIADLNLIKSGSTTSVDGAQEKLTESEAKCPRLSYADHDAMFLGSKVANVSSDDIGNADDLIERQRRLSASVRFEDELPRKYATVERGGSMKRAWKMTLRRNSYLGDLAAGQHEGHGHLMREMAGHTPKNARRRRHPSYEERLI